MKKLLIKEIRLAASPLSFLFLAFSVMALIPGYPILVGSFFVCFGIFHSFQATRETNDILYSVLLPLSKSDTVKGKFAFSIMIQLAGFLLMGIFTLLRMTVLAHAEPYVNNVMMNANQLYLAFTLLLFLLFNLLFICGFFKTGYRIGIPFLYFGIAALLLIGLAETLHHLPGLGFLNNTSTMRNTDLWLSLAAAAVVYTIGTWGSMKYAMKRFQDVDL